MADLAETLRRKVMSFEEKEWPPRYTPGPDAIRPHPVYEVSDRQRVVHSKGVPIVVSRIEAKSRKLGVTWASGPVRYVGKFPVRPSD